MKAVCIFGKNRQPVKRNVNRGSTAFQIFDRTCQHPFLVDMVHLRMKTGAHNAPVVASTKKEAMAILNSTVLILGTVIEMSDYYQMGATVGFEDPKVAARVYKAILDHMEAHLNAMRTDRLYEPPKDNVLRELGEFATVIRNSALVGNPNLDKNLINSTYLDRIATTRSFISFNKTQPTINKTDVEEIVKPVRVKDAIEKWMDMMGYGEE